MTIRKEITIVNKNKKIYIYHNKEHILTIKNYCEKKIFFETMAMVPSVHIFHEQQFRLDPGEKPPFRGHRGKQVGKIPEEHSKVYKQIGSMLKNFRTKKGLSVVEVCDRLSVNLLVMQKTESGRRRISKKEIELLSSIYGVDPKPAIDMLSKLE